MSSTSLPVLKGITVHMGATRTIFQKGAITNVAYSLKFKPFKNIFKQQIFGAFTVSVTQMTVSCVLTPCTNPKDHHLKHSRFK